MPSEHVLLAVTPTMPPLDSLPMLLLRLREAMLRRLRPHLRAQEVTEQQWRVLRVLGQEGVMDMQGVARLACLQPPSLSRIMRRLVARGMVRRLSADVDQRRVQVRLTPAGEALLADLGPELWRVYGEMLETLGPDAVAHTTELIATMLPRLPAGEVEGSEEEE